MSIGINWKEVWKPVWKAVWTTTAPVTEPSIPRGIPVTLRERFQRYEEVDIVALQQRLEEKIAERRALREQALKSQQLTDEIRYLLDKQDAFAAELPIIQSKLDEKRLLDEILDEILDEDLWLIPILVSTH